jgi:drug/metabolite transporter (DMT)-like permease
MVSMQNSLYCLIVALMFAGSISTRSRLTHDARAANLTLVRKEVVPEGQVLLQLRTLQKEVRFLTQPSNQMAMWVSSVILTFVGTTLSSTGLLLQKYSHHREHESCAPESDASHPRPYYLSWMWLVGLIVFICGHISCWLGLALGSQIMLSCLNVWSMVVTFIFAPAFFKEKVSLSKIGSLFMIMVGVVIVVRFGPHEYRPYTVTVLRNSFHDSLFLGATAMAFTIVLMTLLRDFRAGDSSSASPTEFTLLAVIFGSYSVLSAKSSAGIFLSWASEDENQFGYAALAVPLAMIVFACLNLHFMNMALKHGEAVSVVPLYECLSILSQVFLGGIFFGELEELSLTGHYNFWVGVIFVLSGVFCMHKGNIQHDKSKNLIPAIKEHQEISK